ncbi:MAG: PAS domain-containing protein, partial [Proteobacteria bacterium]|nr:PAS domain-containing protein [Pseudomonadota bacterium]
QDVIRDPPFTKLDLLSCRNLLIYLEPALQQQLLALFHYSLLPGGALFLGSAESLGAAADHFDTVAAKARLFRRRDTGPVPELGSLPTAFVRRSAGMGAESPATHPPANFELLTDKWVLQHHAPAAVLVTDAGDILYASARTGRYLEPAVGKANLNVFAMAREGLRHELASVFQKARREGGTVVMRNLAVGTNGGEQTVDLTVQALTEPTALQGKFLIVLADAPTPAKAAGKRRRRPASGESAQVAELTRELAHAREEVQATREEAQSSQEELKSANEELQSTNEELQSTNEELTTSREEMQSLNEELQTLNAELSLKVEEFSRTSADMKNLLNSTDIATIFLDGELRVRRFTDRARNIVQLIPGDVGRPFTDLTSKLLYPKLVDDAREVLHTLAVSEREVTTQDGSWYQVRILPYRTLEDRIDGVVITCAEITAAKKLEAQLRAGRKEGEEAP